MVSPNLPVAASTSVPPRPRRLGTTLGLVGLGLLGALWSLPSTAVQAQTTVNYAFEDGLMRGTPTPQMHVAPKILTESGNHFMRITGSKGDCYAIPSSKCPPKNRSSVRFTSDASKMPLISDANKRQTYSMRLRYGTTIKNSGVNLTLYQTGPATGGYGTADGKGPVIQISRRATDGHIRATVIFPGGATWRTYDLGYVALGTWHTYRVKAVWSDKASEGRFEFYLDGTLKKTHTGYATKLSPDSDRLPMLKIGMYGDYALGTVDVDQVTVQPWLSGSSSTLAALTTPSHVRLVSGD